VSSADRPESIRPVADDGALLARVQAGDERAFELAFRSYYTALARFAWRYVKDRAAAEDLVNDVFTTLWTSRHALRVTSSLRAYLYAAVRNRALNDVSHRKIVEAWQREELDDDASPLYTAPLRPDEALDISLRDAELAAAFETLPPRQALAMTLRWRDGLSYSEIAEALGISERGVEKHLARGLQALRERLI
jgi:RNA polymerase sigma-70 factor, ECF subfamily